MRKPRVEARKVEDGSLGHRCVGGGHEGWFIAGEQCELAHEMWGQEERLQDCRAENGEGTEKSEAG